MGTSGVPKTGHEVLKHPEIAKIASKHGKSTANVVIRWHLQMGGTLCTKSVTPSRIQENFNVWDFTLTDEDMAVMESLNVGWRHLLWAETSMHPDYPFKDCLPYNYKLQKPGVGATAGAKLLLLLVQLITVGQLFPVNTGREINPCAS